MKNQYFADVNDFRKYGMLRILAGNSEMRTAICWMLTENDVRTDGQFVGYLGQPGKWRAYDADLFDSLVACMQDQTNRSVKWAEENHLISSAVYFSPLLTDKPGDRHKYFMQFQTLAAGSELVFFDPDNGIEVGSVPFGRKGSNKYIYWDELLKTFASGKSILIYQHFHRVNRERFSQEIANRCCEFFQIPQMFGLTTANVLFLLIPQSDHQHYLAHKCSEIPKNWRTQIFVREYLRELSND